jgi:DNA-directed RNA polymerase subunit N (RpoN/RPB10)
MEKPYPQPPLYLCPPNCFSCGNPISHIWIDYRIRLQELADGKNTDLPIRSIGDENLVSKSSKTVEGKILDEQGVVLPCCRGIIMSQPVEQDKVPFPLEEWAKFKEQLK